MSNGTNGHGTVGVHWRTGCVAMAAVVLALIPIEYASLRRELDRHEQYIENLRTAVQTLAIIQAREMDNKAKQP